MAFNNGIAVLLHDEEDFRLFKAYAESIGYESSLIQALLSYKNHFPFFACLYENDNGKPSQSWNPGTSEGSLIRYGFKIVRLDELSGEIEILT